MSRLLLINLFISLLWPTLTGTFTLRNLFLGFAMGLVVLSLLDRPYGRFTRLLFGFTVYVIYAILESNVRLAVVVLQNLFSRDPTVEPGIIGIPLELVDPFDVTALASIITLTPGTLSVDLRRNDDGGLVLYVHAMDVRDPAEFRRQIKERFEKRLVELRQLVDSMETPGAPRNRTPFPAGK